MKNNLQSGFTLIELLTVVGIISLLAALFFVSLNSARMKAVNSRIQVEVAQIRTQLEQNYSNATYFDINGSGSGNTAVLSASGYGLANITTTACDIGSLNLYPTTVTGDLVLTCNGVPGTRTGVVIYSNQTGSALSDFGIYATTTPGGYVCVDSFGNTRTLVTGSIPAYSGIASPSTALCQ